MFASLALIESSLRRQGGGGGCGAIGCFSFLIIIGVILYFVFRGRGDKPEQLGTAKRAMGSGPVTEHSFACPYAKCPRCAASADKMKQQWDGLRKVTWTCGYCGNVAGVQELKDEELPPVARQRLGLDPPPASAQAGLGNTGGSGMDGLLTGMMIGSMMSGGEHHHHQSDDGWSSNSNDNQSDSGGNWGDAGSGDSGSSDSGSDWGDSGGGGDSGGSDW
jgi:hypothetical protein